MRELLMSLVQFDIKAGDPETNREKVKDMIEKAAVSKPDIIILPEMWNTGYSFEMLEEICDRKGCPSIELIQHLAGRHSVNIVAGSIADLRQENVYNTCYLVDRKGNRLGEYSKVHLFRLMGEDKFLTPGDTPGLFELEGIKFGVIICYDLRFPELVRGLALKGAKIVFVTAQWPHPRQEHWVTLLKARAIENQLYVVAVNRVGKSRDNHFFGSSMVIDPWGNVLVQAGDKEAVINARIDLQLVEEVRKKIPVFSDRNVQAYQGLV